MNLRTSLLGTALISGLILSALMPGDVYADGAAVFASVTNAAEERRLKAQIESDLETQVATSSVWVDATNWTRLHSAVMSEQEARALVASARSKGYDAWYNSSGNQWATTADEAPRSASPVTSDYRSQTDWDGVKPATGDISHLPMAETFPID